MTWFKRSSLERPHRDVAWEEAVRACLDVPLTFHPLIHPDHDIPAHQLAGLSQFVTARPGDEDHQIFSLLKTLIVEGTPYPQKVAIRLIQGLAQSAGDDKFNIYKLPESMRLVSSEATGPESFGPLDIDQMQRLKSSIMSADSGAFTKDGLMRLDYQDWDHCYIIGNKWGHARRLALWCRLQNYHGTVNGSLPPQTHIPAMVRPLSIDAEVLNALQMHYRLVFAKPDPVLSKAFLLLRDLDDRLLFAEPAANGRPAMIMLPQLNSDLGPRLDSFVLLHRWSDRLFDLGRYIAERIATYSFHNR